MKIYLIASVLVLLLEPVKGLWPAPQELERGKDVIRLAEEFDITLKGSALLENAAYLGDLMDGVKRTHEYLINDNLQRLVVGRGESDRSLVNAAPELVGLNLVLADSEWSPIVLSVTEEAHKLYEDQDESYTLNIPSNSTSANGGALLATLSANTTLGLIRGLQTFSQLVYTLPSGGYRYIINTPISIRDAPAFSHRAFMLDTSRAWFPVDDILRTLDAMSWAKLNVLHWHATDSQSWPLFIPAFPELSQHGAYSSSQTYSRSDITFIREYAGSLGITILLEIDIPGHTASIGESHPEYIACRGKDDKWERFAVEPPTGQLKLGDPATQAFAEELVKSASDMMSSPYFSTGGDEINDACYEQDLTTTSALLNGNATLDELLSTFVEGVHHRLRAAGKTSVVWEEMALNRNIKLANDTIVTVWISSANVRAVADKGHRIIHAASDYFYLDCGAGGWVGKRGGSNSWCDPFKSWQKIYSFDPFASLDELQHSQVLGGEALLWTEQAGPENLDSIAWPRAAAAAEVFWSRSSGGARNATEALPRLHDWRYRAVNRGVGAVRLQPEWCALRPHACDVEEKEEH
ncbi:glycoside hydrolase family 20 protein [Leucosporidium creatinivorum]|uniref:Beta-hexosaminidase n=1 Tax=Leucosporidium creatinivorum TaxID=106004 RepID=A0A1Y2ECL3_9BASI|nr:glycoside hydrolase family 20 protein [Leucosporidium creatinivorum]